MGLEDTSGVGETGSQHASQAGLQLQGLRECWLEGLGPQEGPGPHWGSCSRAGTAVGAAVKGTSLGLQLSL